MGNHKKILAISLLILVTSVSLANPEQAATTNSVDYSHFDKATKLKLLTPLQYKVTQEGATESAFNNAYWNNKNPGIYVDIVSGEPLFSSTDKFDSGTGWPSFTKPIDPKFIDLKTKTSFYFFDQTEVVSHYGQSHLGDLFTDGPPPTNLRYCIDSASLLFIPASELKAKGYGQYQYLFQPNHSN